MQPFKRIVFATLAAGALALAAPVQQASAEGGVQIGVLTCNTVEGTRVNLLIHSTVDVECVFRAAGGGEERYKGETGIGLGVDLNWRRNETIPFTVISAQGDVRIGAHSLAGKYGGAKASATVGVGAGAAVLVGGGANNITLQPLALEGSTGLGVAAGLGYLYLEPAG